VDSIFQERYALIIRDHEIFDFPHNLKENIVISPYLIIIKGKEIVPQ